MTSVLTNKATRWMTVLVATALVLAFLVGGEQRSATAIGAGETKIAYVADGYNFPDALMGATVAALNAAPMLGVRGPNSGDFVPDRTAAELDRLTNNKANKLDTIYIFGGPAAVSDNVKAELAKWANNVERIFGQDRFGTMEAISKALPSKIKDSDLLDGKDSGDFALSDQSCAPGQVVTGIAANGTPTCATDNIDGGNAETVDGLDSTDLASANHDHLVASAHDAVESVDGTPTDVVTLTLDLPDPCGEGNSRFNVLLFGGTSVDSSDSGHYPIMQIQQEASAPDLFGEGAAMGYISDNTTSDERADRLSSQRLFTAVEPGTQTFRLRLTSQQGVAMTASASSLIAQTLGWTCGTSGATASSLEFQPEATPTNGSR